MHSAVFKNFRRLNGLDICCNKCQGNKILRTEPVYQKTGSIFRRVGFEMKSIVSFFFAVPVITLTALDEQSIIKQQQVPFGNISAGF